MQNPNQMISKTMIFDEVALGLQGSGLTEEQIRAKVADTLKVCGLYPFRNWPISALSFGQKKRVTIASVLVQDPELIILDEMCIRDSAYTPRLLDLGLACMIGKGKRTEAVKQSVVKNGAVRCV